MKPKTPGHRVLIKPDTLDEHDPVLARAKQAIKGFELAGINERKESTIIDTGIVVELGPTAYQDFGGRDKWCKVGDKVSYTRHGGKAIYNPDNQEEKWLVINDEDIIMVWEKV